ELEREKFGAKASRQAANKLKEYEEEQRQRAVALSALARSGKGKLSPDPVAQGKANPNSLRFALQQRQHKHQVVQGDGRAKMLSKVFLNGAMAHEVGVFEWIYAA
ncbi:unnamed protein product, partial [Polarella glacialis]